MTVHGNVTSSETVDFTVDTGFSGELTLPRDVIHRLNLPKDDEGAEYMLADGTVRILPGHIALAEWHGQPRNVTVIDAGSEALPGMQMLCGNNLNVEASPGGAATITELS